VVCRCTTGSGSKARSPPGPLGQWGSARPDTMEQQTADGGSATLRNAVPPWPPPTDSSRPRACPGCKQPAYEKGRVWIQGHGLVRRQQLGPQSPGQAPGKHEVACRRYRCLKCGAVLTVLPQTAVARKHYAGAAVALALTLWGLCGWSAAQVRAALSPRLAPGARARGWRTLARWARQVAHGKLFAALGPPAQGGHRQVAARAAQALCGWADPQERHLGLEHLAWAGACRVT
jgi:hypothetical protein